jgi:RHS repeat-associated protein
LQRDAEAFSPVLPRDRFEERPMNRETEPGRPSSQHFGSEGGRSKSNAIDIPSLSLPTGGGAIKGIDEKFSVNAANGTASLSIPLPFSQAREASPALSLDYNSGAGNGVFGLGWTLSLPSIKRKTDGELPQYLDSDTFLFSETEDLVPELKKERGGSFSLAADGNYIARENDSADGLFTVKFYRLRIEGLFSRIERWTHKTTGEIKWRVISKENKTTLFGWSAAARISDPKDGRRVFQWLPEFVFDDRGNCAHYVYGKEDDKGLDSALLHNRNRLVDGAIVYTNLYLEAVLYGNRTPYRNFGDAYPPEADYFFRTVFDYGEYDAEAPYARIKHRDFRSDPFSEYKPGFEIRTTRLCKRILLFHHFAELPGGSALVKSLNLSYADPGGTDFAFLKSMTEYGYIKKPDGTYAVRHLPPVEFEYRNQEWNKNIKSISQAELMHRPAGLEGPHYQFIDLYNEGLSGMLTEHGEGWYYQRNLGQGRFTAPERVSRKPSFAGVGSRLQVLDLDGDGCKQLVSLGQEPKGYFELNDEEEWQAFRSFESLPNINIGDSNVRLIDLNGDGKSEILVSEANVFTWYESTGRKGFTQARKAPTSFDEERDPQLVFADATQTIFLADMSGDGLADIVRVRNGQVCYWPNLGYGRFGARVSMDNAPVFDHPGAFDPARLRLADIDGSGTTDIIYLGKSRFTCWKNLSGNRFSAAAFEIEAFPEIHSQAQVSVANLLGDGVACIVWSSGLAKDAGAPLKYIDLMSGKKAHLLIGYKNNLGKEVSLEYTSSARFYLEDRLAGRPWVTKLHFPVHCVSKTETRDKVSGHRFVSSYKYHHGYYDHAEREFRGFGMVEQVDSEDFDHWIKGDASNIVEKSLHQPPVVTRQWFHTGAWLGKGKTLNQFAHEYWHEEMARQGFPAPEQEARLADIRLVAAPGLDTSLVDRLSGGEWREALRACKGRGLRSEVFAHDAPATGATPEQVQRQLAPYSVEARNYVIELLQPKGPNKHAVFVVRESETIVYDYDRDILDPRTSHHLNLELDEYGNVLASAAITYPRTQADASLPDETQWAQGKTVVLYTRNRFTNDAIGEDGNRLRLPSETMTFELQGVARSGRYYGADDFQGVLSEARTSFAEYAESDRSPVDGKAQARLIEHVRNTFYNDELTGALPLHRLNSLALPCETYQLAYTPSLLADVFGTRVDEALMLEGRFTHCEGDSNWWVRSGSKRLIGKDETALEAKERFYSPIAYVDPYGAETNVSHYRDYFLFIEEIEDAAGNKTSIDLFNFRTLSPARLKDANANLSEVLVDELGLVKAMAVYGKGGEADDLAGLADFTEATDAKRIADFFDAADSVRLTELGKDLLQRATARFAYDFGAYLSSGKPAAVASIVREEHDRKNRRSPIQISFEYSNGLGQVVMKKAQSAPGTAKRVVVSSDDTYTVTDVDTAALNPRQLRWIGSGRRVLNNKGNTVKQYEPYFSVSHKYEDLKELVETGVTPLMVYDALGRLAKTEMPDGTFSSTAFGAWKQIVCDANDTVLESPWYHKRVNRLMDAELIAEGKDPRRERTAAEKAARHADTPEVRCFDVMGRTVLSIEHNRDIGTDADEVHYTRFQVDVEGNLRSVIDARGNVAVRYKHDMLGNQVYQDGMDSGQRWLLANVLGSPLRAWDERNHEFRYAYEDPLHRPTESRVLGGDGPAPLDHVFDRRFYGEAVADPELRNVRGQVVKHYDTAGLLEIAGYDFNGRPTSTTRRLSKDYKGVAIWVDANLANGLDDGAFTFATETDALGRTTRQTTPDGSVIMPSYDEGGLLRGEAVAHAGSGAPAVYIKDIAYNERGQRERIVYGNGVVTNLSFDKQTFRLKRLETKRRNGDPLQDWRYTFDPAGNVTCIEDRNAPAAFFDNQKIGGVSAYTYDALYRLREASGRENSVALDFGRQDVWNDAPFMRRLNPGDPLVMRNYIQSYEYDEAGNILRMRHQAADNNWTREYAYQAASNRLIHTRVGANTYAYSHHRRHGTMTSMPHLEDLQWSFKEELASSARQKRGDGGAPETTYYQYDAQGRRIRKITENQAAAGEAPTRKEERVYLDGYELYTRHSGEASGLERVSVSLMDGDHRFVMVETRNDVDDGTEKRLVRYQLHNHLGSASLELDDSDDARVISYEEYHPYGTTAYQARNAAIRSTAKRYRFTGMERDEESGLEYHGARYYAPWLARWLSCDPLLSENLGAKPPPKAGSEDGKDAGTRKSWDSNPAAQKPPGRGASENRDSGKTDGPSPKPKRRPDPPWERTSQDQEGSYDPRDLNPYAYVSQNPVVYRDPTGEVAVIQAWYDGYNSAGTAGKVGFGFLFIFAWLAHVILNLAILILAVTILNPAGLFGALDFTWGAPQSILGLLVGTVMILLGADVSPRWGLGAKVEMPAYMGMQGAGMSLGPVVLGAHGFQDWKHEFGHTWQSRLLGPFYLLVIALPSVLYAIFDPAKQPTIYTEKWADAWAT